MTEKTATKADRIVVRLESEMRAKVHKRASALGLHDAAFVRMLIYRAINGIDDHAPASGPSRLDHDWPYYADAYADRPAEPGLVAGELEEAEPPRAEEMEIRADPDGDLEP